MKKLLLSLFMLVQLQYAFADGHESKGGRAEALIIEARVLALDYETREASLELPMGYVMSIVVDPAVERLSEIKVGDVILATYFASIAGEVREPTEQEKMQPFLMITDELTATAAGLPGRAEAVIIRAVCTIEGMNRITGRAMVKDSRGSLHVIEDIPAERFEGVTLGSTVVITYTQAVAIGIEKRVTETEAE